MGIISDFLTEPTGGSDRICTHGWQAQGEGNSFYGCYKLPTDSVEPKRNCNPQTIYPHLASMGLYSALQTRYITKSE